MDLELAGSTVLISGGSHGIGLAIAQAFANEGCNIAIAARHLQGLQNAAASLGKACSLHVADVTDEAACFALAAEVEQHWRGLDILITNVGSGASVSPGAENAAEWQRMMAVNLYSASNLIAACRPLLARAAKPAIICISSICGREVVPKAPVTYSAAKAALEAMVRGLARPFALDNIRINAVAPGNIVFEGGDWERIAAKNPDAVSAMLKTEVAQSRFGQADWVADAVLYLSSPRAAFITGTVLVADGGQVRS